MFVIGWLDFLKNSVFILQRNRVYTGLARALLSAAETVPADGFSSVLLHVESQALTKMADDGL